MIIRTNVYCFHKGVSPDSVVPNTPISVPFDDAISIKFLFLSTQSIQLVWRKLYQSNDNLNLNLTTAKYELEKLVAF